MRTAGACQDSDQALDRAGVRGCTAWKVHLIADAVTAAQRRTASCTRGSGKARQRNPRSCAKRWLEVMPAARVSRGARRGLGPLPSTVDRDMAEAASKPVRCTRMQQCFSGAD